MERGEDIALALGLRQPDRQDGSAMRTFDARQLACLEVKARGGVGMNVERRLALMRHQARQPPGAGHGVPLVAQPSGIEEERPLIVGRRGRGAVGRRHKRARHRVWRSLCRRRTAFFQESRRVAAAKPSASAHHRPYRSSRRARQCRERPRPSFSNSERAACSRKIPPGRLGKGIGESHAPRHFGEHPPIGARLARRRTKGTLPRNAAFGIGNSAVLFPPAAAGRTMSAKLVVSVGQQSVTITNGQFSAPPALARRAAC